MIDIQAITERIAYDPITGLFTRKLKSGLMKPAPGSSTKDGYLQIDVCGKKHYAHRLAWIFISGAMPRWQVDHINGVRDDNRSANLRDSMQSENNKNRVNQKNSSSKLKGVSFCKGSGMWRARIQVNGKRICLGYYDSIDLAKAAYDEAASKLHGRFANFGYSPISKTEPDQSGSA